MTKPVLSILRQAAEPMTSRDIALELLVTRALDKHDQKLLALMTKRVGVTLRLQRVNRIVRSSTGRAVYGLGNCWMSHLPRTSAVSWRFPPCLCWCLAIKLTITHQCGINCDRRFSGWSTARAKMGAAIIPDGPDSMVLRSQFVALEVHNFTL